jgi:hypothetical protein
MRRIGGKNAVRQRKGFSNGFGRGIAADEVRKTPSRKNIRTRPGIFRLSGGGESGKRERSDTTTKNQFFHFMIL